MENTELFLLENDFIKTKGKFGDYFYHQKQQLFRCWFHDGKLQVGKKDYEKDVCIWIATIENVNDFLQLFRILTSENLFKNNQLETNNYSFEIGN